MFGFFRRKKCRPKKCLLHLHPNHFLKIQWEIYFLGRHFFWTNLMCQLKKNTFMYTGFYLFKYPVLLLSYHILFCQKNYIPSKLDKICVNALNVIITTVVNSCQDVLMWEHSRFGRKCQGLGKFWLKAIFFTEIINFIFVLFKLNRDFMTNIFRYEERTKYSEVQIMLLTAES